MTDGIFDPTFTGPIDYSTRPDGYRQVRVMHKGQVISQITLDTDDEHRAYLAGFKAGWIARQAKAKPSAD